MTFRVTSDAEWDAAYWQWLALNKSRAWWNGWDWRIYLGGDEYWRRTVVIGPVCIALWRSPEWREVVADCDRRMDKIEQDEREGGAS